VAKVVAKDRYFLQKKDAVGRLGLSELQKICSAVRQLKSAVLSSEHDIKYRMGASTGLKALRRFCNSLISVYGKEALRHPTATDIDRLLDEACQVGFPGCIGSIDCIPDGRAWYLKPLPIIVVGFGISISEHLDG
jgi:hypothetical protein